MSMRVTKTVLQIHSHFVKLEPYFTRYSTSSNTNQYCIISCKNRKLNHFNNTIYNRLDEVPLASKGWNHPKSRGDSFIINPVPHNYLENMVHFHEFGVSQQLVDGLASRNIKWATEFQAKAFPLFESNKHLMLAAETGCGKTVAYLLPILHSLKAKPKTGAMNTPRALILVPNRELAYQVGEMANILAMREDLNVHILVGGRTKRLMMNPDFKDVDILIGTPGAIGKLSSVGIFRLNDVIYTVLDEADTLCDDSFISRLEGIVRRVPQSKIILVSATIPKQLPEVLAPIEADLEQLISPKLHKPLLNVSQKFLRMSRAMKTSHLMAIAKTNKHPMLIFTNRNETCNWLALFLRENNVPCANINGNMNYAIRIEQWNNFIRGEVKILSATDVGSRGLDTIQVRHVVNYDFPLYAADYLHRIGRVGRMGSTETCKATNFISGPEEVKLVQQIELAIRKNQALTNVDGNITSIVQKKLAKKLGQTA